MPSNPESRPRIVIRSPLAFFEWLLVGFLLTSGVLHLMRGWGPSVSLGEAISRDALWEIAVGTFSVLLSGQVFLRTPAARFSISLLFLMQVIAFVQRYAIKQPERWLDASDFFRTQRLVELSFFAIAMVLVHLRPKRIEILS
jgi:hypothetical protein